MDSLTNSALLDKAESWELPAVLIAASYLQEVDQQAIDEALGIEVGKGDEDEDDEQEGMQHVLLLTTSSRICRPAAACHMSPC